MNLKENSTSHPPSRFIHCLIVSSFIISGIYFLLSLGLIPDAVHHCHYRYSANSVQNLASPTSLEHIVFGIAGSGKTWSRRKEYVSLWWRPGIMKGCVFLEQMPPKNATSPSENEDHVSDLPPICISADTSGIPYDKKRVSSSTVRVVRVVSETVALNYDNNVRWFVFGDDDTFFFPDNLVKTLQKYDHGLWYYIGASSEFFQANKGNSFEMAFGGGGFALSYPLAKVLAKVLDSCQKRFHWFPTSDKRLYACLTELGISLTHEPGFHQVDVKGDIFGLLSAHAIRPLVTLHHMDAVDPIFPNMTTLEAVQHLMSAAKVDSERILQQTVCYDKSFSSTISVSWGYAIQWVGSNVFLSDIVRAPATWDQRRTVNFDVQQFYHPDPCSRPTVFFFDSVSSNGDKTTSIYKIMYRNCTRLNKIDEIRVFSKKLDLSFKQAPRRQCCDVFRSSADATVIDVGLKECGAEETIQMQPVRF
ncbi:OLC1v1003327C1 [Oldenlandia corymbosa var. corymbosa]|uniref:OLC1v1003327C1 n=1 Tax=Oldenlandia corymbosa var. corymbosa TaxID=529605 RepID=A0AAV1D9T1_OLDCO|nr:OLC1v1003327C1 [Oldenlandia corymbosa var. corymbosa]